MQQVSSVRGQHLDKSDWKSLCLAEWIQRGQQRDPSAGTRLRTGAGPAELDVRSHRIRSGGIFHLRQSAALRGCASQLVQDGRASNVIHADGSNKNKILKNPTAGHVNIPIYGRQIEEEPRLARLTHVRHQNRNKNRSEDNGGKPAWNPRENFIGSKRWGAEVLQCVTCPDFSS